MLLKYVADQKIFTKTLVSELKHIFYLAYSSSDMLHYSLLVAYSKSLLTLQ